MTDDSAYGAAIAPHIDRTVVAVHPAARPAAMAVLRAAGLAGSGLLVPLLADRIEAETNRLAAQPYQSLDPADRTALRQGLERL